MFIVHVSVDVREESVDAFIQATLQNAKSSMQEPGVARFDVIQDRERSSHFMLVEVYRTEADTGLHKETEHYKTWRDTVAPMMAAPRQSTKFNNLFPDDPGWG